VSAFAQKRSDGGEAAAGCGPRLAAKQSNHAELAARAKLRAQCHDDAARALAGAPVSLVEEVEGAFGGSLELRRARPWCRDQNRARAECAGSGRARWHAQKECVLSGGDERWRADEQGWLSVCRLLFLVHSAEDTPSAARYLRRLG